MSREPLQAALGEIAHRTPSGEVGKEAFGGGVRSEVGDLAGFGCWAANPSPSFQRSCPGGAPGRGDHCPAQIGDPHLPGSWSSGNIICEAWRLWDETPRHRWGLWHVAAVLTATGEALRGAVVLVPSLQGRGSNWVLASCLCASGPWWPGIQGATGEAETWAGTEGPGPPGAATGWGGPSSLGSKAALPRTGERGKAGHFSLGVCASCGDPAVPRDVPPGAAMAQGV